MEAPRPARPGRRSARKQRAIDLIREVGEELGDERGKGFEEGDDYEEVKANLTSEEKARLQTLDTVDRHHLHRPALARRQDHRRRERRGPVKAKAG